MGVPANADHILAWVRRNRPDIYEQIEKICNPPHVDDKSIGMFFLLAIGFAAGHVYGHEHPEDVPIQKELE